MKVQVHLFAGAGGAALGTADKNAKVIAVDKSKIVLETFQDNLQRYFARVEVIQASLDPLDADAFDPSVLPGHPWFLWTSPPCQTFSQTNRFPKCDLTLVNRSLAIMKDINPRWWVMEEVPAVGKYLPALGVPRAQVRYLRACDFGLAHRRRRLFAGNYPPVHASPHRGKTVHTPVAAIRGYGHGKEHRAEIRAFILGYKKRHGIPHANDRGTYEGVITPAVYAHLMGFPEDYVFHGTTKEQYIQIGNAVCPPVARAIYKAIRTQRQIQIEVETTI